jgi:hypothetical protein
MITTTTRETRLLDMMGFKEAVPVAAMITRLRRKITGPVMSTINDFPGSLRARKTKVMVRTAAQGMIVAQPIKSGGTGTPR